MKKWCVLFWVYQMSEQIMNVILQNILTQCIGAINWSAHKHRYQKRKNTEGTPYINHPIGVMNRLISAGVTNPDILCGAVLHDTIEDVGATFEEITERFSYNVSCFVMEVTDDKSLDKVKRKRLQVRNASKKSDGAKLIKLADKLDNLEDLLVQSPKGWSDDIIAGYFVWSYCVVSQIWDVNALLKYALINVFKRAERKYPTKLRGVFNFDGVYNPNSPRTHIDVILEQYYDCIESAKSSATPSETTDISPDTPPDASPVCRSGNDQEMDLDEDGELISS